MGLDLTLLPAYSQNKTCDISHDMLFLHRDSDLFDLVIEKAKTKGVEVQRGGINSFYGEDDNWEEPCYGKTETDKYGERIKSLLASELEVVFSSYETDSWKNKAVFAFVKELPKDLPVYLFWH